LQGMGRLRVASSSKRQRYESQGARFLYGITIARNKRKKKVRTKGASVFLSRLKKRDRGKKDAQREWWVNVGESEEGDWGQRKKRKERGYRDFSRKQRSQVKKSLGNTEGRHESKRGRGMELALPERGKSRGEETSCITKRP